jgi:hypothetical protein
MKLLKRLSLLLLVALTVASSAPAQSRYDEFTKRFAQAQSVNDKPEMAKLVKTYQGEAVMRTEFLCSQVATYSTEEVEREIEALRQAWQSSMKGRFVDNYYAYLALMKPPQLKERQRLKDSFEIHRAKFVENQVGGGDGPVYERVAGEMEAFAGAFTQTGDNYYTAMAWMFYGLCYTTENRDRKDVDKAKVYAGFKNSIEAFEALDLKYKPYFELLAVYETLKAEGWGEVAENPDAPPPGAPKASAKATSTVLTFEAISKWDAFERPNYFLDEMYQLWPALYLKGKGTSAAFDSLEKGPLVKRSTSSALEVDFNRDGTGEAEIKLTGKKTVVECDIVDGGAPRKWAFLMATGQQQDKYQGLQVNLQPEDTQMSMFYVSAASMVGTIGDQPVRIIDDNADGVYGSAPRALSYVGLSEGQFQPDMDSVVVGAGKRALPWSEFFQVGEQWFRLESVNSGTVLSATPMEVETGTIKLDFKGPAPTWVIVRGEAMLENSFFDLMANGKSGIEVPRGIYTLYVGQVAKGKKQERMKALILPGNNTPSWEVEVGKETVVKLGAPFGFSFATSKNGEAVTVLGNTVTITGSAGEFYERPWNCAPRPEGSIRKEGAKKGSKGEKMGTVMDLNEMKDGKTLYTYGHTFRPLDTVLVWKKDDPYEVQLVEKKNKLFGKIESTWQ